MDLVIKKADKMREVKLRTDSIWGVVLHTTGSGVLGHAKTPLEVAVTLYTTPPNPFPHYVIGYEGEIVQIAEEKYSAWHVGVTPEKRSVYLSGEWANQAPAKAVELWRKTWPGRKSPAHLYPGTSVNNVYVGIEMVPQKDETFTEQQYKSVVSLCKDIGKRHVLPDRWWTMGRLVGHEDVGLLDRCDKNGGWDPGYLREKPRFDFDRVRHEIGSIYY